MLNRSIPIVRKFIPYVNCIKKQKFIYQTIHTYSSVPCQSCDTKNECKYNSTCRLRTTIDDDDSDDESGTLGVGIDMGGDIGVGIKTSIPHVNYVNVISFGNPGNHSYNIDGHTSNSHATNSNNYSSSSYSSSSSDYSSSNSSGSSDSSDSSDSGSCDCGGGDSSD